jgi:hypothetical protein
LKSPRQPHLSQHLDFTRVGNLSDYKFTFIHELQGQKLDVRTVAYKNNGPAPPVLKEKAGRLPIKRAEAPSVGTDDLSQVWVRERFTEGDCGGFEATAHGRAYDEGLNGPRRKLFPQRWGIRSTSGSEASFALAFTALIPDEWFAAKALHMPCQDDDVGVHLDASPKAFVGTGLPSKAEENKRPKGAHCAA